MVADFFDSAEADHDIAISTSPHSQAQLQLDQLRDYDITSQGLPRKSSHLTVVDELISWHVDYFLWHIEVVSVFSSKCLFSCIQIQGYTSLVSSPLLLAVGEARLGTRLFIVVIFIVSVIHICLMYSNNISNLHNNFLLYVIFIM